MNVALTVLQKQNAALCEENDRLVADNSRMIEAGWWIIWMLGKTDFSPSLIEQFKDRAFPPPAPQFEEMKEFRWDLYQNGMILDTTRSKDVADEWGKTYAEFDGYQIVELTGTRRVEVKPKVKQREELEWSGAATQYVCKSDQSIPPIDHRRFAEWES